jgi:hypothetical protein
MQTLFTSFCAHEVINKEIHMETDYIALVPSYRPDGRLVSTAKELLSAGFGKVVIVNDGSGSEYEEIFEAARA